MEIIVAIIGSGALSAVISGIFALINKGTEKKSAVSEGVQMLLWDKLVFLCNKYIDKGEIRSEDLKLILDMHKSYKRLGGNGYVDCLLDSVKHLPIR